MAMTPNEARTIRELEKVKGIANERIIAMNKQAEELQKSLVVVTTLALYLADKSAQMWAPEDMQMVPFFPHFVSTENFQSVWNRVLAGEGLAVQDEPTGVTIMRVAKPATSPAATEPLVKER